MTDNSKRVGFSRLKNRRKSFVIMKRTPSKNFWYVVFEYDGVDDAKDKLCKILHTHEKRDRRIRLDERSGMVEITDGSCWIVSYMIEEC